MLISPPFLPKAGLRAPSGANADPMMDVVDTFELDHGLYPIAFDRRWHCGIHLRPDEALPVHAIADGEIVAYRVCQHRIDDGHGNAGFVLLKHSTETGEGRTLTFYSLYMHLLELADYQQRGGDASRLPECLRMPTGRMGPGEVPPAVAGVGVGSTSGKRVRRKDVLGWVGMHEGMRHLHFEIFMTRPDFDAYFGATQLGAASPRAPQGVDWWGHAWFVVPAGKEFRRLPPGTGADNRLHGIEFTPGQAGSVEQTLHMETYFSLGARYTRAWSIDRQGRRTLLTTEPAVEKDYEYDLYKRATALYPACPSDGYELLRFGRILSRPETLDATARATWIRIPYAADRFGYIDVNAPDVLKLSDADFAALCGWQKISDDNTPFDRDGVCDVDALKRLVNDASDHRPLEALNLSGPHEKEDLLTRYVRMNPAVRHALRGFVCLAPSEWDSTHNETRYAKLRDEGEFYHGNERGYAEFLAYLAELQFWDKTGLPAGEKIWFFHPLAFIRHFRKCGWMSLDELAQVVPANDVKTRAESSILFVSELRHPQDPSRVMRPARLHAPLMQCMRKYGIATPMRVAHWFGQVLQETGCFRYMRELGSDEYLSNYYEGRCHSSVTRVIQGKTKTLSPLGNCQPGDGLRFSGKGMIQITGGDNYRRYQTYKGGVNFTVDPAPQLLVTDPNFACDTAGYYWASKHAYIRYRRTGNPSTRENASINYWADLSPFSTFDKLSEIDTSVDVVTMCINTGNHAAHNRRRFFKHAFAYVSDNVENLPVDFKLTRV